ARREYLPDQLPTSDLTQTILTLPERPKELIGTGRSSDN
ncbi:MAG: NADH-quinone oxidoreductase subunit J, partial [Aphanizomenon sp.]